MDYDTRGFVSTPHGRVFYGVRGSGPAMILLDGIGCDGLHALLVKTPATGATAANTSEISQPI